MPFKKHTRDASSFLLSTFEKLNLQEMCHLATFLDRRHAIPATSSNFSVRTKSHCFLISKSGLHKRHLTPSSFVRVGLDGVPLSSLSPKPSDETKLHSLVYQVFPHIQAIAHCHAPEFEKFKTPAQIFLGHEILKLFGHKDHHGAFALPVFQNSQDMEALVLEIRPHLENQSPPPIAFMLERHGIYCFGESVAQVQNYLEAFFYLIFT